MAVSLANSARPTTISVLRGQHLEPRVYPPSRLHSNGKSSIAVSLISLPSHSSGERDSFQERTGYKTILLRRRSQLAALVGGCQFHRLGGSIVTRRNVLHLPVGKERRIAVADEGGRVSPVSVQLLEEDLSVQVLEEEEELVVEVVSKGQVLWRAAKLPIYSVAIVPLSVGGAAAFWQTGVFNASRYWLMFWSSILIITWLNLSNDAYDSETGVDKGKRESLVNITGSQKGVLHAAHACLALGFTGLVSGASQASDVRVAVLLAAAIGCGYVYQCPPFRLSYQGLGEPLCFLAFGPFATTAFYLSQAQPSGTLVLPVTLSIFGASVLVGITTTLILFCSHFHQIEGDTLAGKMSPLVRMGTENGSKVVQATVIGLYLCVTILTAVKALPLSCTLFSLLTLPIGKLVLHFIKNNHSNKGLIFMAKYYAVRLHVSFGVALILGFSLASRLKLPAVW